MPSEVAEYDVILARKQAAGGGAETPALEPAVQPAAGAKGGAEGGNGEAAGATGGAEGGSGEAAATVLVDSEIGVG